MTTTQEVSSSKHKIDSLTSDFFRAVSFFEGNKPAYQNLYKLFIESGQLIKNSAILPETKYSTFVNLSNLAKVWLMQAN